MKDFITLTCPSCGGKLLVGANTSVLVCEHCGIEHLVRREKNEIILESFARCPKCGRNDKVEKVSSILKSHQQVINTTEQRTKTYIDKNGIQHTQTIEVPITQTQVTGLAQILKPPAKPNSLPQPKLKLDSLLPIKNRDFLKIILFIIAAFSIGTTCLVSIGTIGILIDEFTAENLFSSGACMLFFIAVAIVFIIAGIMIKPSNNTKLFGWQPKYKEKLEQFVLLPEGRLYFYTKFRFLCTG